MLVRGAANEALFRAYLPGRTACSLKGSCITTHCAVLAHAGAVGQWLSNNACLTLVVNAAKAQRGRADGGCLPVRLREVITSAHQRLARTGRSYHSGRVAQKVDIKSVRQVSEPDSDAVGKLHHSGLVRLMAGGQLFASSIFIAVSNGQRVTHESCAARRQLSWG